MSYYETAEQRAIRQLRNQIQTLNRQNAQASNRNRELTAQIERQRRERQNAEERASLMIAQAERRNEALSASLQALNAEVERQEEAHRRRIERLQQEQSSAREAQDRKIRETADRLQRGISQTQHELQQAREETAREFESIRAERERDLAWVREEMTAANARIDTVVRDIEDAKAHNRELAEYWIQQSRRLITEMRENYRPVKFRPDEWANLQQSVRDAETDLKDGRTETAVSGGRAAFRDAMELRTRLAEEELRWQSTLDAVRSLEREILQEQSRAESTVYTLEIDGQQIEDRNGIDYWTYGHYALLAERIAETRSRLNADTDALTTGQLTDLEREMQSLQEELALLENASADNFALAQGRFGLADRIGTVLGDEFHMVDADGDFFARQPRDEYHAVFYNPETQQSATVVITPEIGEDGRAVNHAEVLVNTSANDPAAQARVSAAVERGMKPTDENFSLPCSGQYGERTAEEARRMGDVSAVSEGVAATRSSHATVNAAGEAVARCASAASAEARPTEAPRNGAVNH